MVNIPRVSVKLLESLRVGDTCVVTEPPSRRGAGSSVTGYASRAGIKVTTAACVIVLLRSAETVRAVLVTRV